MKAAPAKPKGASALRPHNPRKYKQIPWAVCRYCGIVYLRNDVTRKAIKRGCWKYEDE